MADFSYMPAKVLPKLKECKFVEIDRDNFEHVMESINPHLVLHVPNTLGGEDDIFLLQSSSSVWMISDLLTF